MNPRLSMLVLALIAAAPDIAISSVSYIPTAKWYATTVRCPMCGTLVEARVVGTTPEQGTSPDLCPDFDLTEFRVTPTTCTDCLYSATPYDFDSTNDTWGPHIFPEGIRRAFADRSAITAPRPIPPGTRSPDIEPWVRQALVAETSIFLGTTSREAAQAYLVTTWLIRDDTRLTAAAPDRLSTNPLQVILDAWASPAASRFSPHYLAVPMTLLELARGSSGPQRHRLTLTALLRFRMSGENDLALALLAELEAALSRDEFIVLRDRLTCSIESERRYQRLALEYLTRSLEGKAVATRADAADHFLRAELERRLGDHAAAVAHFNDVIELAGGVDIVSDGLIWDVTAQRRLAAAAAGRTGSALLASFRSALLELSPCERRPRVRHRE